MLAPLLTMMLLAAPPVEASVKVEYGPRIDSAARMPIVYSTNNEQMLFFRSIRETEGEQTRTRFVYCLAKPDGTDVKTLYETPVDWDDFLNTVSSGAAFADDGRIAVATTDNRHSLRGENPGKVVPATIVPGEDAVAIECEYGSTGGFGFVGNDLLFLDTSGSSGETGYKLKRVSSGQTKVLDEMADRTAFSFRISPDRNRVVFFTAQHIRSSTVRLRMLNLKTGESVDSPEFRSQDVTFDGRPQLFWDADSEGVFCHVSVDKDSKWPFELTHYDFDSKTGYVATSMRNLGASCVLDSQHVSIWHPDVRGCSILHLPSKRMISMPAQNYVLGGRGNQVIIADLDRDAIFAATLQIPEVQANEDSP